MKKCIYLGERFTGTYYEFLPYCKFHNCLTDGSCFMCLDKAFEEQKENNMNEKELKMGDEVEVLIDPYRDIWDKKIFVKLGNCGSIIVVSAYSTYEFKHGESFSTKQYYSKWRIPKQKTYRPFTWEEREQLRGKWITRKVERDNPNPEYCIAIINNVGIYIGATVTFKALYEDFIFLGGSPVGKLEE